MISSHGTTPKSMTLGALAKHLANIPSWMPMTFDRDEPDVAPPDKPLSSRRSKSIAELLEAFDQNVTTAARHTKPRLTTTGRANGPLMTGKPIFTLPRTVVIRGFLMKHRIRDCAQLGVYLRLLDVPVPSIYGPSADDGFNYQLPFSTPTKQWIALYLAKNS